MKLITFSETIEEYTVRGMPNTCPFCHRAVRPRMWQGFKLDIKPYVIITFQCPATDCQQLFFGYYEPKTGFDFSHTSIGTFKGRTFSEEISSVSPSFVEIYNQALSADQMGLGQICGVGYRKALEFVLKDFLCHVRPDKEEEIKKALLGQCISNYVTNPKLKSMAERAIWLGNDETHYVRKWEDKDINDLKLLIDIATRWIETELLTEKYEAEMAKK